MNPVPNRALFYLPTPITVLLLGCEPLGLYLHFAEGRLQGTLVKGLSPSHTGRTHTEKLPSEVCRDGQVSWDVLVGAWFSSELFIERVPRSPPTPMESMSL